ANELINSTNPFTNTVPSNANAVVINDGSGTWLSVVWDYKKAGVYFYSSANCRGISTYAQTTNGKIERFTAEDNRQYVPGSFQIVNGTSDLEKYGVVLTTGSNAVSGEIGICSMP